MLTRLSIGATLSASLLLPAGLLATADVALRGATLSGTGPESTAVVWLEAPNAPAMAHPEKVTLAQRNLRFDHKLLAVRVGTVVDFPNDDRVFHNVFSFHDGKRFDLGTYPVGTARRVTFSTPGVSRVFCNIHPHMAAYVVTVDSPYFVVVNQDGTFEITDVPAGMYTYRAWRPAGPVVTGSVALPSTAPLQVKWP